MVIVTIVVLAAIAAGCALIAVVLGLDLQDAYQDIRNLNNSLQSQRRELRDLEDKFDDVESHGVTLSIRVADRDELLKQLEEVIAGYHQLLAQEAENAKCATDE